MVFVSARRKTFAAREDLIDAVKEIARRRGYSLYDYVNELFEVAIKAEKEGYSITSVVNEFLFFKQIRESGFVLLLENLFQAMVKMAYRNRQEARAVWRDAGLWMAKSFKAKYGEKALSQFKSLAPWIFWDIPEFEIRELGNGVEVFATSPRFSPEYADLFRSMVEGFLEGLGYRVDSSEVVGKTVIVAGRSSNA
ncbi:hypothetical protein [Thermogladius sp.]|uniref:hypothetical protein n=1 Tax=Thermogladius sp. TaxID=2023064 RepID=UPI003D0B9930